MRRPGHFASLRHRLISALGVIGLALGSSAQGIAQIARKLGAQSLDVFALPSLVSDSVRG